MATSDAELLREWSVKIREVGTAKGWSVWAAAYMNPDVEFVDTGMPSTESVVAELRRLDRVSVLREVDEQFAAMKLPDELKGTLNAGSYADAWRRCRAIVQAMAKEKGSRPEPEPLVVSRYDVAMEPASEEEPVFTVGAVAEDGRPVALCFAPETRRKVAAWLAPTAAERLAHASAFEVPRPGRLPLLVQRSYGHADRWVILDHDGHCWDRDGYWVAHFGGIAGDAKRDSARFTLAEVWPLVHQIAAGETAGNEDGEG
ncbi:hypothetical protein SAZ11_07825 [Streptomyces sp. FXJ1.4098]|nr:hypothetical protein [Streptomyces sp. FXJ1.4098]